MAPRSGRLVLKDEDVGTPEMPSPPRSVKRVAQRGRLSVGGTALAASGGQADPDPDSPAVFTADSPAVFTADSPAVFTAESSAAPPTRELRNTPARQARGGGEARSARKSSGHASRRSSGRRSGRRSSRASFGGAVALAEKVGSPLASPPVGGGAASQAAREISAAAPTELTLATFPAKFQHGAAAEQIRTLHRCLSTAAASPSAPEHWLSALELGATQRPGVQSDVQRITLLLEVMESRKVVVCAGHGAERRWRLALA